MGKFGKQLFGGSESSSTTPTSFGSLPEEARNAFLDALSRGEELSLDESLFTQPQLTGTQQSALSSLQSGTQSTSAGQFQSGLNTFFNPFEEQVVQNAIGDITEQGQGMRSDISSMASAAGGFGGTRQALLESELNRNILRNIGEVSASTRSQGFESAANRVLGDIARSQEVAGSALQLGDIERQIQFANQQAPIQANNYLMGLAQGFPTGGGTVSKEQDFGDGALQGIGKAAAGIGSLMMMSDRRLKENITKIGREKGLNIYEFTYKNNPDQKYKGVMAQEVLENNPDCVGYIDNYLAVNYSKLGIKMERI